jgi:hypothetical protein
LIRIATFAPREEETSDKEFQSIDEEKSSHKELQTTEEERLPREILETSNISDVVRRSQYSSESLVESENVLNTDTQDSSTFDSSNIVHDDAHYTETPTSQTVNVHADYLSDHEMSFPVAYDISATTATTSTRSSAQSSNEQPNEMQSTSTDLDSNILNFFDDSSISSTHLST